MLLVDAKKELSTPIRSSQFVVFRAFGRRTQNAIAASRSANSRIAGAGPCACEDGPGSVRGGISPLVAVHDAMCLILQDRDNVAQQGRTFRFMYFNFSLSAAPHDAMCFNLHSKKHVVQSGIVLSYEFLSVSF